MLPVVVDVNVVVSSLVIKGVPFTAFILNKLLRQFEFVAPELLLAEFEKHEERLLKETRLSRQEFSDVVELLFEEISLVPSSQFSEFLPSARVSLSAHKKDAPYLALALKLNCPIFSGDKVLKKLSPVKVLSPREMLEKLLESEG